MANQLRDYLNIDAMTQKKHKDLLKSDFKASPTLETRGAPQVEQYIIFSRNTALEPVGLIRWQM